jgi:hypothetical protein
VKTLKRQYVKGQAGPFFSDLHAVWADEVAGRGVSAGDAGGTAGAGAYDGAAADEGGSAAGNADSRTAAVGDFGPSGDERGIAVVDARASAAVAAEGFVPAGDASRGSAVEAPDGAVVIEGAAAAGDAGGTASVAARGGAFVHEDCRAAAVAVNSCLTSDGINSERTHRHCRGRVKPLSYIYEKKHDADAVFGAAVGEERGGASVDGHGAAAEAARRRATFVPPPIPKRPRSAKPAASSANTAVDDGEARVSEPAEATVADLSAQALAAGSVDAVVMMNLAEKYKEQTTKLAEIYKELRMKMLDVEMEKAAAGHAGAGRRA